MVKKKKIGDKIEIEFWDRLELKLRMGKKKSHFKGWRAALMREILINGAAMTINGAQQFIEAGGQKIGSDPVIKFLQGQQEKGLLKTHEEPSIKDKRRKRVVLSSNLEREKFLFKIIVHEEAE